MITVCTEIEIQAPIERVFDLATDIGVHTETVWKHTKERAIAGTTAGSIGAGETVTFEATHFLVRQRLTSRISEYDRPYRFVDEMVRGAFKSMRHKHEFVDLGHATLMRDTLKFEAPFGIVGRIVEQAVLKRYMRKFLEYRNKGLKERAEKKEG